MDKMQTFRPLKLLTLLIVILVLIIPSSSIIAGNLQSPTESKTLSVYMNDVNGYDYSTKKVITNEEYNELNATMSSLLDSAKYTMDDNSPDGKNITILEWDDIQNGIIKVIEKIKALIGPNFPYAIIIAFLISLINLFHGPLYLIRQPLLSFGIGITWLPFYDYETFLGKMLRPIFIRHLFGFSATARLNPFRLGFPYWYFGPQRVRTFLFRGLLINFAELGIDRIIGPQLLIGYGVFTGFTH
ncbi:MAG TPA: hypothetical protein VGB37_02430 [Candidatus Lokiarchaeia archaeon]